MKLQTNILVDSKDFTNSTIIHLFIYSFIPQNIHNPVRLNNLKNWPIYSYIRQPLLLRKEGEHRDHTTWISLHLFINLLGFSSCKIGPFYRYFLGDGEWRGYDLLSIVSYRAGFSSWI